MIFTFNVILLVGIADAKDFSNIERLVRSVTFKVGDMVSVERAECFDLGGSEFGCGMEPTVANEFRVYQFQTEDGQELPYNATLIYIDEQQSQWTLQYNGSSPSDPRLFINGTQLEAVALENQNVTEGGSIWTYLSGSNVNRIDLHTASQVASNFTVYFPQNNNTQFATKGRAIEGNFLNGFPKIVKEKIIGWYEHFNPTPERADRLIDLLENDRETLYKIILKKILDRFDNASPQDVKRYGKALLEAYKENNNLSDIIEAIENKVRNQTGYTFGEGDNPNHAVRVQNNT